MPTRMVWFPSSGRFCGDLRLLPGAQCWHAGQVMTELIITSPANVRLKSLVSLRRRRAREDAGLTLIEGYDELSLALDAGVVPRAVYHCPELMLDPSVQQDVVRRVKALGSDTQQLGRAAFEKVAYRQGPDGFLAVVDSVVRSCADLSVGLAPLALICQGVEKPGNLGAMLRTADAAGVEAVVAVDPVTDWSNPNLVRASKGTVFSVPVASAGTAEALAWLSEHGIALAATTPDTDLNYTDVDYTGPIAIAVGAEKYGLTEEILAAATYRIRIPMAGRANSLNVATSAAVVIYEAVRQRGVR
jgi:TrmH family RNA methyltransferase